MKPPVYPLPFIYESTGAETRFTNGYDPEARSRRVFTFHRPETLAEWSRQIAENPGVPTFRARLQAMPPLDEAGLWGKQGEAIRNLESHSLAEDRPRSLIQMATGSGKTFTAANVSYRLIRHADAKRILFLVDRSNLGRQTKLEFDKFTIAETQRKFPAEYNVQHLTANMIDPTSRVCISTIQRVFSILKGDAELDPETRRAVRLRTAGRRPGRGDLQPGAAAGNVRHDHHRRVPPLDLRSVAAGAGVLRRAPDRADRDAEPSRRSGSSARTW